MRDPGSLAVPARDPHVVWHDLECGAYRADLGFWHRLADAHPDGSILDIGAGSGRVTLELARRGRRVIALDNDPALLATLRQRAQQLDIDTVCADARAFELPRGERVALCIAPMQTVQLLGGPDGRCAFLRCARAQLLPGGLLACAILTQHEPFDCTHSEFKPWPETLDIGGLRYVSQATRVQVRGQRIAIERERRIAPAPSGGACAPGAGATDAAGEVIEHNLIHLDRLSVPELEREGAAIVLRPEPARQIPPTADYEGSSVVMLRA
jgi:SAM-dependent methyltransferase